MKAERRDAWTPQNDATLVRLWNVDGKSAGEIGAALNVTRNAVIGRISRLRAKGVDIRKGESGEPSKLVLGTVDARRTFHCTRPSSPWTEELTVRLIELWNGGLPASRIASVLNINPKTIDGKVTRLRASGVEMRRGEIRSDEVSIIGQIKPGIKFTLSTPGQALTAAQRGRLLLARLEARGKADGTLIENLARNQCRRPVGGSAPQWLFCGEPTVPHTSWCAKCRPFIYTTVSMAAE